MAALDPDNLESDAVQLAVQQARREFEIDVDMTRPIANFEKFRQTLASIRYAAKQATQDKELKEPPAGTNSIAPTEPSPTTSDS